MPIHLDPDKCLSCFTCLVHCPVASVTTKFLGPRLIGPAFERFRLLGVVDDDSLTYCANCKNCEIACPQNVPIASINMLARQMQAKTNPPSFRDWICAHGESIARATKFVPSCVSNWAITLPATRLLLDALGIARHCPMPSFAKKHFRDHIQSIQQEKKEKKVVFFPGCYVNYYDPATGFDFVWLLQKAGYEVIVPKEFVCCGIPLISGGFEEDARKNAKKNAETLACFARENIPVVTVCPSCRLMLTREVKEFFPEIIQRCPTPSFFDSNDFLLRLIASHELDIEKTDATSLSCIYHAPCHQRALGEGLPAIELLELLNVETENANAGCCGISGSYGFKKEKYRIAQAVGENLFAFVNKSASPLVASECGTCRLQIHGATHKTCVHPVTLVRAVLDSDFSLEFLAQSK